MLAEPSDLGYKVTTRPCIDFPFLFAHILVFFEQIVVRLEDWANNYFCADSRERTSQEYGCLCLCKAFNSRMHHSNFIFESAWNHLSKGGKCSSSKLHQMRIVRACPLREDEKWRELSNIFNELLTLLHFFESLIKLVFIAGPWYKDASQIFAHLSIHWNVQHERASTERHIAIECFHK